MNERFEARNKHKGLEVVLGATIESAKFLDSTEHNFLESAKHYFSVYHNSENEDQKFGALMGLIQQEINLGNIEEAGTFISEARGLSGEYGQGKRRAAVDIKEGWLSLLEKNHDKAFIFFARARGSMLEFNATEYSQEDREVYSSAVHFLGRTYFAKGRIEEASGMFTEHLEIEGLAHDEKGYSRIYLARCNEQKNQLDLAENELHMADYEFGEYIKEKPLRMDVISKLSLAHAELMLREGKYDKARYNLELSFGINNQHLKSFKEKAIAIGGLAMTYWQRKDFAGAFIFTTNALVAYISSLRHY